MLNNYDYKVSLGIAINYFIQYDKFQKNMETFRVNFNKLQPVIELTKVKITSLKVVEDVLADNEVLKIYIKDKFQDGEKFLSGIEEIISLENENSTDFFITEQCNNYVFNNELLFFISGGFCIASSINTSKFIIEYDEKTKAFAQNNAEIFDFFTKYSEVGDSLLLDTSVIGNTTSIEIFKDGL